MPTELLNLLVQIPLVAVFVWYSDRMYRQFQEFLREERSARGEQLSGLRAEIAASRTEMTALRAEIAKASQEGHIAHATGHGEEPTKPRRTP